MKKSCKILILSISLISLSVSTYSQNRSYYLRYDWLMTSPGVYHEGLLGFINPANLGLLYKPEWRFHWMTEGVDAWSIQNWGVFSGVKHAGLGIQRQEYGQYKVYDYKLAIGFGRPSGTVGFSYGWSTGEVGHERMLTAGSIMRPNRFVSLGLIGSLSLQSKWNEGVAEIGIRPLGTPLLTLFADGAIEYKTKFADAPWSAGAMLEIIPGLNITGRYFENEAFTIALCLNFGKSSIAGQAYYDDNQNPAKYSYSLRFGGMRPSVAAEKADRDKRYVALSLKGLIDYNKYVLFDSGRLRFMDILEDIRAASNDPRVAAVAVNLSGLRVYPEHAWEIREELLRVRQTGRKVFVFIDQQGMTGYHLASAADAVIMDPEGYLNLPGYVLGSTYFKGTLEKLGLGFDEWRFHKYKSMAEVLSREGMSEADREQNQAYVDDWYEMVRGDVCRERSFTAEEFDELIDETIYFTPDMALEAGLVDTLARWTDRDKIIRSLMQRKLHAISPAGLFDRALPPRQWGDKPRIAIVYGIGDCDIDRGIKARWLERVFYKLARDRTVKAVVFRVDSPGGYGIASDMVAQAVKICADRKPVVVSQGQVAASGGYWLSMYADTIVAGPNTVTGSIGVIGGWLYDKSLSDKLGMSTDFVCRGKHADYNFDIRIPFTPLRVPARNLTGEERTKVEKLIGKYYESFAAKVAEARSMTVEEVHEIAEGRFYSGFDGVETGLVDKVGGLTEALKIVADMAGFVSDGDYDIVEIPKSKGLINFGRRSFPFPYSVENDPVIRYLEMLTENPGRPLPMLIPGTYPGLD